MQVIRHQAVRQDFESIIASFAPQKIEICLPEFVRQEYIAPVVAALRYVMRDALRDHSRNSRNFAKGVRVAAQKSL